LKHVFQSSKQFKLSLLPSIREEYLPLPKVYKDKRTNGFKKEDFKPDLQFRVDEFPVVIIEAKRPLVANHLVDEHKLLNMMKLSIDLMSENGIEDPTVVGFLIYRKPECPMFVMVPPKNTSINVISLLGVRMSIFIIDLRHEALYFAMPLAPFTSPLKLSDLSSFGDDIGKLFTAKVRVACHLVPYSVL
jgi:hypothetical protein